MEKLPNHETFSLADAVDRQLEEIRQNGLPAFETSLDHQVVADIAIEGIKAHTDRVTNKGKTMFGFDENIVPAKSDAEKSKEAQEHIDVIGSTLDAEAPLTMDRLELFPEEYDRTAPNSMEPYFEDFEQNAVSWADWILKTSVEVLDNAYLERLLRS